MKLEKGKILKINELLAIVDRFDPSVVQMPDHLREDVGALILSNTNLLKCMASAGLLTGVDIPTTPEAIAEHLKAMMVEHSERMAAATDLIQKLVAERDEAVATAARADRGGDRHDVAQLEAVLLELSRQALKVGCAKAHRAGWDAAISAVLVAITARQPVTVADSVRGTVAGIKYTSSEGWVIQ